MPVSPAMPTSPFAIPSHSRSASFFIANDRINTDAAIPIIALETVPSDLKLPPPMNLPNIAKEPNRSANNPVIAPNAAASLVGSSPARTNIEPARSVTAAAIFSKLPAFKELCQLSRLVFTVSKMPLNLPSRPSPSPRIFEKESKKFLTLLSALIIITPLRRENTVPRLNPPIFSVMVFQNPPNRLVTYSFNVANPVKCVSMLFTNASIPLKPSSLNALNVSRKGLMPAVSPSKLILNVPVSLM